MKSTFSDFVRLGSGRWHLSPELRRRLGNADIESLDGLLRWTRERYPTMYRGYSLFHDGSGKQAVQELWAEYLKWKESA